MERLQTALNDERKIPFVAQHGRYVYNVWRDANNPRGLWRRTSLKNYLTDAPSWENLLDIDQLNAREGRTLIFAGAEFLKSSSRVLISLAIDGGDTVEIREFNIKTCQFVTDGFRLTPAKAEARWLDASTILFTHAEGEEHITRSGYGRTLRKLKRGMPLESAVEVFSVAETDMGCWFRVHKDKRGSWVFVWRSITFEHAEHYVLDVNGALKRLNLPRRCDVSAWGRWLAVQPQEDWHIGDVVVPAGGLGVIALDALLSGATNVEVIFTPSEGVALEQFVTTTQGFLLKLLDRVRGRVVIAKRMATGWRIRPMKGLPDNATISIDGFANDKAGDERVHAVTLTISSFTRTTTYAHWTLRGAPRVMKTSPSLFDADGIETEQRWATASDGTQIPYFIVGRHLSKQSKPRPTLLVGYGGFGISNTPAYAFNSGMFWLEHGFNYVLANIRGGGEFGPAWHDAGKRTLKHVSHDDFAEIAKHLIASGVTTPAQLGCNGASNGGLLVGAMLTRYPDLFGAILCQVPLLDMARYTRLLAGHSWIAEYGDPDDPEEWKHLRAMSPYHLASAERRYPPILITTSRSDDRVHPAHARKMTARLEELQQPVLYYETMIGGHSGYADNTEIARSIAMAYRFFKKHLAAL
jgi:prolyl oligopeptidase